MSGTLTRRRNFAMLPEKLITDPNLSDRAVRLWARLDRYAGEDGRAFPSVETLARELGCSTDSISRALAELTSAGWITREKQGPGRTWNTVLNERQRRPRDRTGAVPDTAPVRSQTPHRCGVEGEPVEGEPENSSAPPADAVAADGGQLFDLHEPAAAADNPVQVLVAAYVDAVKAGDGVATTDMRKAIGANVKRIIRNDDVPMPVLLVAVQRAGEARAKNVDRFLGGAQKTFDRQGEARRAMFAAWEERAAQVDGRHLAIGATA